MDAKLAARLNIPLTETLQRKVKVIGGGILDSNAMALNCQFTIQGQKFTQDSRILELQGSDIILGVDWFKKFNPVTFDFVEWKLTMQIDKEVQTFQDHLLPRKKSANQFGYL